jgi:peptidoglycan/xylan/chitin deacetylase (PgdA/CDA1 family)
MTGGSVRDRIALAVHRSRAAWKSASGSLQRQLDAVRNADAVLMYHRVLPDAADASAIEPGMYVRASTFERHLDTLTSRWQLATLSSVLESPRDDRPRVALTFDDGWRDNLETAWPILRSRGLSATIFLVTDWCAAGRHADGTFIRPDEIRELAAAGIEFGAHTMTHPALDTVESERARIELEGSKRTVAEWTGMPCRVFAYPYGRRTPGVEKIAASTFDASVVVGGGWWHRGGDSACLPRISIHDDMTCSRALFEERLVKGLGGHR